MIGVVEVDVMNVGVRPGPALLAQLVGRPDPLHLALIQRLACPQLGPPVVASATRALLGLALGRLVLAPDQDAVPLGEALQPAVRPVRAEEAMVHRRPDRVTSVGLYQPGLSRIAAGD